MRLALAVMLMAAMAGCATVQKKDTKAGHCPASKPAVACEAKASAAAAEFETKAATVVDGIKGYTFGQSREPLAELDALVKEAQKCPKASQMVAGRLAALLSSDATPDAKRYACRALVLVGSTENVPAIAPLLVDEKMSDMARYALEPMQGEAVDCALIDALGKAPDAAKVGIINTLGVRKTASARSALDKLSQAENPAVAEAAKAALTRIGN